MLQNAYFLAKIGADTAENERNFAEILPKIGNYPTRRAAVALPTPSLRTSGVRPSTYVGSPTQLSSYQALKGSFSAAAAAVT